MVPFRTRLSRHVRFVPIRLTWWTISKYARTYMARVTPWLRQPATAGHSCLRVYKMAPSSYTLFKVSLGTSSHRVRFWRLQPSAHFNRCVRTWWLVSGYPGHYQALFDNCRCNKSTRIHVHTIYNITTTAYTLLWCTTVRHKSVHGYRLCAWIWRRGQHQQIQSAPCSVSVSLRHARLKGLHCDVCSLSFLSNLKQLASQPTWHDWAKKGGE